MLFSRFVAFCRRLLKWRQPANPMKLFFMHTASISEKISIILKWTRLLVQSFCYIICFFIDLRFNYLLVIDWGMQLSPTFFLTFGSLFDIFSKILKNLSRKHQLIYFSFGLCRVVSIVYAVNFKPLGTVNSNSFGYVRYCEGTLNPNRWKFLELHIIDWRIII